MISPMRMHRVLFASLLLVTAPASTVAQTPPPPTPPPPSPLLPGYVLALEGGAGISNGVQRTEAMLAFEYRIDGGAPVPAVKVAPCRPVSGVASRVNCELRQPAGLTPGAHRLEVRALISPAEAGIVPSAWSLPLDVMFIVTTPPTLPARFRVSPVP